MSKLLLTVFCLVTFSVVPLGFSAGAAVPMKCAGQAPTITGTPGDDVLHGTPRRDVVVGLAGDDRIVGWKGRDVLCGGGGADNIFGGPGRDKLSGGLGADKLSDGRGDDTSSGGIGDDFFESAERTSLDCPCSFRDTWNDRIDGGPGRDELMVFGGSVNLTKGKYVHARSHDRITRLEDVSSGAQFPVSETIIGNERANRISGGSGDDVLRGLGGNDAFETGGLAAGHAETGAIYGGGGEDLLNIQASATVDLRAGTARYAEDGKFVVSGIDDVRGLFGSLLMGDGGPNVLIGGSRTDSLHGRGGNDELFGRLGDDYVTGGPGDDRVDGGEGTDVCRGGESVSNCE